MDFRDKQLNRHMQQRVALATELPVKKQRLWAQKCVAIAARQRRTAFYMMANFWLASIANA